ncbi:MAG: Holliday junction resolvase RuvX [Deltaproteobacteria bacterium]|nr:Holliday junction resolvase RuvX [Deltaproteobacteria bacterium]
MTDATPGGRILGLDYGNRRIGMAVSDPLGLTAQPLPAIARTGDRKDIAEIGRRAAEIGATSVVLGLPLLMNGDEGPAAVRAREFGARIEEEISLPVTMWDERMTTMQSERHLIDSGVRREKRKGLRDSLSAMFILQSVLDLRNRK